MRDFIFIHLNYLYTLDPDLRSPNYKHRRWFDLLSSFKWAWHTNSRVTKLDTPWPLASTVCPIPEITNNELRFDVVIDSIAEEFCQAAERSGRTVYLCWSGGIDSTSILVSLLRVAPQTFLDKLVIVTDLDKSLTENAYFYYRFIHNKFKIQDLMSFEITADNYNKIIVVDGECGNQCMQGPSVQRQSYRGRFDLLNMPWRSINNLSDLLVGSNEFHHEIIKESIQHAPVAIDTGYDFLWWTGFNFKFDDVLIRKMFSYSKLLNSEQTAEFWKKGLYRFYQHPVMQMWSMNAKDLRRQHADITPKYFSKKYIYEFDRNDFYWASKTEQGSDTLAFAKELRTSTNPYFAFDDQWNKYSMADRQTRQLFGKMLERV